MTAFPPFPCGGSDVGSLPPGVQGRAETHRQRVYAMNNTEDVRTITGYIVPISLNDSPDPAATVALEQGDKEFHIEPRGAGIDLADQINVKVEARGTVREKEGVSLLHVRSYKLIDEFDSEWYDDDE